MILKRAQPSPQTSPFARATSAICGLRSRSKREPAPLGAAVPSCLASCKEGQCHAAPGLPALHAELTGLQAGATACLAPCFLGTEMARITVWQHGAFPASFPHSRVLLLTLIPRQETAPCSQPNPLLGCGGCNAGSQPLSFTGLAGKAAPASLLQILRPLPEASGFCLVGGSR